MSVCYAAVGSLNGCAVTVQKNKGHSFHTGGLHAPRALPVFPYSNLSRAEIGVVQLEVQLSFTQLLKHDAPLGI